MELRQREAGRTQCFAVLRMLVETGSRNPRVGDGLPLGTDADPAGDAEPLSPVRKRRLRDAPEAVPRVQLQDRQRAAAIPDAGDVPPLRLVGEGGQVVSARFRPAVEQLSHHPARQALVRHVSQPTQTQVVREE